MKLIDAYHKLTKLNVPVLTTNDAAACLKTTVSHASKILSRLCKAEQIVHLARGLWGFADKIDILNLPQYLTAPFPSYISLQSALYQHGMISQIPAYIYAVSLARARRYHTPLADVSIHHLPVEVFTGFELLKNSIALATPEKSLFDYCYLCIAKTKLFTKLPELELPANFDIALLESFINKIPNEQRQSVVRNKLNEYLN